ncbi:MAG: response regulator [Bacteroidetes bacterium]|nr:response regulator [Bacteroidota bacterium]MBU1116973.1 response regulator [Bacteroidota bacterium]MBU1799040.1 response regulator [Bacteroidota bacterium]
MAKKNILIVEDEYLIALDLKVTLIKLGFTVSAIVTSGEEAIKHAEIEIPDLILMDINLETEMDGIDAATEIYSKFRIPIIFVTAYSDSKLIDRAKKAGSFGYMLKPYNQEELYAMIEMVLDKARVEKELEINRRKLEEEIVSKDKFFSIISHDLKNPLSVIISTVDFLDAEYDDFSDKERKELINLIKNGAKNTYELLESLLNWSRARLGSFQYNPKKTDMFDVLLKVLQLFKESASLKKIEIENNLKMDLFVSGDENMLELIMRNLISNAIKFSPNGGKVIINAKINNNEIVVSISDFGIGISEADQQKLFKIGVHHTSVGTNNESGTGLGLLLCKELVEKHNGKIWVESKLGKGSKFMFSLPNSHSI